MTGADVMALVKKNPIAVTCAALSLALVGATYWRSSEIPDTEARLAEKSAEADRLAANIKNAKGLKEQLDAMEAANKAVESRLVHNQLAINQQYFLELFAANEVKSLTYSAGGPAKGAKTTFVPFAFTVAVQGDLARVLKFLRALEGGTHYCRINTASLSLGGARTANLVTASLSLDLLGQP